MDPHEFAFSTSGETTHYFDYIKLRKNDESHGNFALAFKLEDSDSAATVDFYYTTASTATSGTKINTGTTLTESDSVYIWDTTSVAQMVNTVSMLLLQMVPILLLASLKERLQLIILEQHR